MCLSDMNTEFAFIIWARSFSSLFSSTFQDIDADRKPNSKILSTQSHIRAKTEDNLNMPGVQKGKNN